MTVKWVADFVSQGARNMMATGGILLIFGFVSRVLGIATDYFAIMIVIGAGLCGGSLILLVWDYAVYRWNKRVIDAGVIATVKEFKKRVDGLGSRDNDKKREITEHAREMIKQRVRSIQSLRCSRSQREMGQARYLMVLNDFEMAMGQKQTRNSNSWMEN